jgi:hypothetical protein
MKPRQPNWEHKEMLAFIKAKCDQHIAMLKKVEPQKHFEIVITKWKKLFFLS